MSVKLPKPNMIDNLVSIFNPKLAVDRIKYRASYNLFKQFNNTTGYVTSASARRSMRGWNPSENQTADEDTLDIIEAARASSRDLYMNTPVATAALKRMKTNVVGSGLILQSRVDREYLGLSSEEADAWEANTEREFQLWASSKMCDITQYQNFYELQGLVFLSTLMNGDCFVALPYKDSVNVAYSLRIMLIEADMVCNLNNAPDSNLVAGGIELDQFGAPKRYWIKEKTGYQMAQAAKWISIDAYGSESGRRNVIHLLDRERVNQRRGMPFLSPVIEHLKQITRLSEAELMAAVVTSFFTVFIRNLSGANGLAEGYIPEESVLDQNDDGTYGKDATHRDNNLYEIGSGNMIELGDDQDVAFADPKRPSDAFDPFFSAIVRQIGAAIEIPYEQLMLAFTSSYSASRAALLEAWKFYRAKRKWLASNFCQPIYEEWLTEAILRGRVQAPGFFDDPRIKSAWASAIWGGPGQGQIDPIKETRAAVDKIKNNLSTYEDEFIAINGGDWESAMVRKARENRILSDNDLLPIDPKNI